MFMLVNQGSRLCCHLKRCSKGWGNWIAHSNWVTRVCHGYGKTRGFSKTGSAGTGTVVDFGTSRHTVYPYRGITGISRVYYNRVRIFFVVFFSYLIVVFSMNSLCHSVTQPYMALPAVRTSSPLTTKLSPLLLTPIPLQKCKFYINN